MKVDVLSGVSRNEGGLFYSVRWLSHALIKAGVDARLISHIDSYTAEDLHHWSPMPVELHPARGPLLSSGKLRKLLKNSPADLLHVHGIWLDRQWAALQWQKKTGNPVILSPRGMLDSWALKNSAWKKKLVGALFANESFKRATCIHALCESEAESIRAYGIKTPIAVIPNGVELPTLEKRESIAPRKKLLFLGRIHPKKGLDELISGWAKAVPPDWELIIAGWDDGGHEAGLKALAQTLGVADSVSFVGSQYGEKKENLLRSVDGFILPSFSEGLPMSVLEAWSYALPVIMTDFCNIPAGFEVSAAVRIEPNPESISKGLIQWASMNENEQETMGTRGRKLVEQQFTWTRIADQMKAVYAWCNGAEKPSCFYER